jgi:hypothetical protein
MVLGKLMFPCIIRENLLILLFLLKFQISQMNLGIDRQEGGPTTSKIPPSRNRKTFQNYEADVKN